jgi:ABC-type oligopeptide transport system substrate-binding subunit
LPRIREVRFVEANKIDPVQAFQDGKLHILPDVPTAEIEKYAGVNSPVKNKVDVVTSTVNRRIYMLAVNLRRPELQSKQLRKGLSLAIDRDDILRKVFRDKRPDVHRALTGPFPPGTWVGAKGPTIPPSLMDLNAASLELKTYLADQGAKNTIELSFPDNDPLAEKACDEIKKQIEGVFKSEAANSRKLLINLRKVPLVELMVNVQDQHSSFDLAYIPFDYPDDWYPFALGAALDPAAAVERGRNWFSFLDRDTKPDTDDQELGRALGKLRAYRDFSGEILTQTAEITKAFNKSLPFIPLWQLDRHMVVSKRLKVFVDDTGGPVNPRILNQSILFQNVARWRIE